MKQGYTHITAVLDRSGSMVSCAADTTGGFNQFVKDQQAAPGQATMTLVQFDTDYEVVYQGTDIQKVPPLVLIPRGMTALIDAMAKAIATTGEWLSAKPESERPEHVVFVVLTDGHENSSKESTKEQVKSMVQHQTDAYKWQFVFLGANMDAVTVGGSLGFAAGSTATYDTKMTGSTYGVVSKNLLNVRSGKLQRMAFTDEDRKKMK